jgi:hypothetical protein
LKTELLLVLLALGRVLLLEAVQCVVKNCPGVPAHLGTFFACTDKRLRCSDFACRSTVAAA